MDRDLELELSKLVFALDRILFVSKFKVHSVKTVVVWDNLPNKFPLQSRVPSLPVFLVAFCADAVSRILLRVEIDKFGCIANRTRTRAVMCSSTICEYRFSSIFNKLTV